MLIGLAGDMTPIDIEVTGSKFKFRRITFVKMIPLIILRTVYHIAFIFLMLIGPGEGLTPFDLVFFREGSRSHRSLL